jgi:uncharacterized membrane protein
MKTLPWASMHGASVHFPIALVLASLGFELLGWLVSSLPARAGFQTAAYWTLLLGCLGGVGAALTGLVLTKGVILGHGLIRMHHLFAWPAFGLLVALAVWRIQSGRFLAGPKLAAYLGFLAIDALLIASAGYWGGEMIMVR